MVSKAFFGQLTIADNATTAKATSVGLYAANLRALSVMSTTNSLKTGRLSPAPD